MGCDIHAHYEIKIDGEWMYYAQGGFDRNYLLFAKLAGVRDRQGEIEKIDVPRGLPFDVSKMVDIKSAHWGVDGHSHSWVSSKEYCDVIKYIKKDREKADYHYNLNPAWLFGNSFYEFDKGNPDKDMFPDFVEDFRMVFWFDN